jgi:hypothetical protein
VVVHFIGNEEVVDSIPTSGTTKHLYYNLKNKFDKIYYLISYIWSNKNEVGRQALRPQCYGMVIKKIYGILKGAIIIIHNIIPKITINRNDGFEFSLL